MVRGLIIGEGGMSGVKRELWWEVVSVGDCADCGEVCVWGWGIKDVSVGIVVICH